MTLTRDDIQRYKRHLLLKEVGAQGQQKLKEARVLIVGAGGLGAPLILYLAAAGIGHIGIVDGDVVELDNLQRQVAFDSGDIGQKKVAAAASTARRLNPLIEITEYPQMLTPHNALELIGQYDIVADGSDNFATRYLVNDACYLARKPLVFAAVGQFDGQLSTFRAFEQDADGMPWPSYRCIFPEEEMRAEGEGAETENCASMGVLGTVVAVMGSLQATEVIKEILQIGDRMVGRLLLYDALATRFTTIRIKWNPGNPLNGQGQTGYQDLSHHYEEPHT